VQITENAVLRVSLTVNFTLELEKCDGRDDLILPLCLSWMKVHFALFEPMPNGMLR